MQRNLLLIARSQLCIRKTSSQPIENQLVNTGIVLEEKVPIVPPKERFKVENKRPVDKKLVAVPPKPPLRRLPPLPSVGDLLRLYKIRASKHLSQNFLMNPRVIRRFVDAARIREDCHVVEIGPGPGNMTRCILEKNPSQLFVIEKDRRFLPLLEQLADAAAPGQLKIILGDAMDYSLRNLFPPECATEWKDQVNESISFIGNLPFDVATALVIRWLRQIHSKSGPFEYGRVPLTLAFQKEVALRLAAPVNSYWRSRISVMTQTFCHVEEKFIIKGGSFVPRPDVDAGVVRLVPKRVSLMPGEMDFSTYERFVRTLFNVRQQPLVKALGKLFPPDKRDLLAKEIIHQANFRLDDMPMMLSVKEISSLASIWYQICQENPGLIDYDFRARVKPPAIIKELFREK